MWAKWHKVIFWLITEITLNLLGLDNLADYSEFIFEQQAISIRSHANEVNITIPPSCHWMFGLHPA